MPERHEHEPVADALPERVRAQLADLRAVADPYLDRVAAEFEASPTTLLDRLAAVRAVRAVADEDVRLALLAAVTERFLDSSDAMWRTLMWTLRQDAVRRDAEFAQWLGEHAVLDSLERIWAERSREEYEERVERRQEEAEDRRRRFVRPLPAPLEERLQRHELVARPWLARIAAIDQGLLAEYRRWQANPGRDEPLDFERLRVAARLEAPGDVVDELRREPADVLVAVALVALREELGGVRHSHFPGGVRPWSDLNRRALPYEADDLELALLLVERHEHGWVWAPALVRAIERHAAAAGGIPERWYDSLRTLLAACAGARRAEFQRAAVAVRSLLGTAAGASRLDVSAIDGADAWSTAVRERLAERYGDDVRLDELIAVLQQSGTAPRPSAAWRKRAAVALAASPAAQDALRLLLETAVEVRDGLVRRNDEGNWLYSTLGEPAALQTRAAAWAAQLAGAAWAPDLLERLARSYSELLFNGEPHSARVANGAVSALALGGGRDAVVRLSRLQRVMWHGAMRKHLERELDALAETEGLTRGQLLELSAPDLGLGEDGTCTLAVGEAGSLALSLDDRGRLVPEWSVAGGNAPRPSPQPVLRSAEPARVQELQQVVKQARASLAAERERVDSLLAEQPRWSVGDWTAAYGRHPVLRALGRGLVWTVETGGERRAGLPGKEPATFVDVDDVVFTAPADAAIGLWHPVAATDDEVAAWRAALFERRVAQPVRQVFREVYRPAPAERGSTHAARFAGQLLRQQPLRGLLKRRGWTAPALLTWDEAAPERAVAARAFPGFGMRAELTYEPVWTEEALDGVPGGFQLVATGRLQFRPAAPKDAEALVLDDVPALVLSEAMRDVDLVVSVCSVGLDPTWRDVADDELRARWRELAFGELVESARIRRDVLDRVLPELSVADRCAVYERDLVVEGTRATYRVHIGTGQVRLDPDGSMLVVPRARTGAAELARLFLPDDADETLATVLGTAFVLANDDAIADEAFLEQLPPGRDR